VPWIVLCLDLLDADVLCDEMERLLDGVLLKRDWGACGAKRAGEEREGRKWFGESSPVTDGEVCPSLRSLSSNDVLLPGEMTRGGVR